MRHRQRLWRIPGSCAIGLILIQLLNAKACTVYDLGTSSLPSAAATLFVAVPIFDSVNSSLFIDNHRSPFSCSETNGWENGWFDFFEPGDVQPWTPELEKELGSNCKYVNETHVLPMVPEMHLSYLDLQTAAALKMWKFQPWMQSRVNTALKHLEAQPHPIIAFNLRGGNKEKQELEAHFAFVGPEDMMEAFEKSYPGIKGGTCLVVGDDQKMVDAMSALAKRKLDCRLYQPQRSWSHSPHANDLFYEQPLAMRCTHAIQTLVDVELLASADICVGAYKGTLPDLVESIRFSLRGKKRLTFADGSAYYHKDWVQRVRHYIKTATPKLATQHRRRAVLWTS